MAVASADLKPLTFAFADDGLVPNKDGSLVRLWNRPA